MQAKLMITGNAYFEVSLLPETPAEREILRRVGECRELISDDLLQRQGYSLTENERLVVRPRPKESDEGAGETSKS